MTRHYATMSVRKKTYKPLSQTQAAAILGVTREHLNRVLRGHRSSRSLSNRYHALKNGGAR